MATLILELSLTRIFSVVFYYHYAFLAISIALFGLGAGGVLSYYAPVRGRALFRRLGFLAMVNAAVVIGSLVIVLRGSALGLPVVYFAASAPFILSGMIVSLAIGETIERVERVYFYDLLGAAGGCLLLIPLLNLVGGPSTVIGAAALFAASGAVWFGLVGSVRGRAVGVALALALVLALIYNPRGRLLDVTEAKGKELRDEVLVRWNSFSRVAVTEDKDKNRTVVIDGDATTGIVNLDLNKVPAWSERDLKRIGPALPYRLRPGAKTLIIGAGGGWDVARALVGGSTDVTGVEINPIITGTIMRGQYADWSKRIYFHRSVRIVVEDGRSFVRRTPETYEVLQATLVDTWASTAAGAFSLSENNLYTSDAFYDYLSRLTPTGFLAFSRWGFEPPRESLRLLSLAIDALSRLGETDPARHVIVVREDQKNLLGWGALDTVLISRKPFTAEDIARAHELIAECGFDAVYLPDQEGTTPFHQLLRTRDREAFYAGYRYDVRPVNDDRPFFFYSVQPRDLWAFATQASTGVADTKVNLAVPTLFGVVGASVAATLITLLLPPIVLGARLPRERGVNVFLLYFACLGAGYILVQVGLIQKLVLFLGRPTYALTVVIFSMLVSSGVGSYVSRRWTRGEDGRLMGALALVAAVVSVVAFSAGALTSAGVAWPMAVKVLATVLLIAPAGLLMGMPFPLGLARLEQWHRPSVRWAWSMNAASSVFGSAAAIFLAIFFGLKVTLLAGAALYLVALATVWTTRARRAGAAGR